MRLEEGEAERERSQPGSEIREKECSNAAAERPGARGGDESRWRARSCWSGTWPAPRAEARGASDLEAVGRGLLLPKGVTARRGNVGTAGLGWERSRSRVPPGMRILRAGALLPWEGGCGAVGMGLQL